jgi:hypothetical protein
MLLPDIALIFKPNSRHESDNQQQEIIRLSHKRKKTLSNDTDLKIMSSIILMDQLHLEIWIQNVVYF